MNQNPSPIQRWLTYLNERSPFVPLLFIAAGVSFSGEALQRSFQAGPLLIGILGVLGLLIQMRLGDELKDLDKDKVVHPERPLPRGLLKPSSVRNAILVAMALLTALAAIGAAFYSVLGGALLLLSTVYVWLMYKEFYIGKRLADFPMAYAFSHQLIVFPMYGFATALLSPDLFWSDRYLAYLTFNFGASMTFEICRKLDPKAHPLLGTYLAHYGPKLTAAIVSTFVLISMGAGYAAGLSAWLLPVQIPMLLSLLLITAKPGKFKVIEGLAILSATLHIWVFALQWAAQRIHL